MERERKKGYAWAISAGFNAALAAISAKFFSSQARLGPITYYSYLVTMSLNSMTSMVRKKGHGARMETIVPFPLQSRGKAAIVPHFFYSKLKYALVIFFNVVMWGCYVNSMKSLSSLQATVTNFATNFLSSGLSGFFLFEEELPVKWFAGAMLIVIGVIVLSKSSVEKKTHTS